MVNYEAVDVKHLNANGTYSYAPKRQDCGNCRIPYGLIEVSGLTEGIPSDNWSYSQFLGATGLCMPVEHMLNQEVRLFMAGAQQRAFIQQQNAEQQRIAEQRMNPEQRRAAEELRAAQPIQHREMYNDQTRVVFEITPPFTADNVPIGFVNRLPVIGRFFSTGQPCGIQYYGRWDDGIFRDRDNNVFDQSAIDRINATRDLPRT